MSFEFNNAVMDDVMYIVHKCNIVQFLMNARTYKILLALYYTIG